MAAHDTQWDVVVIGGGPAGSTAAAYLARSGRSVLVLEREHFPRHHIGESLLPSLMPILEDFGLVDECIAAGFPRKTGATFVWGKTREPWDILFSNNAFLPAATTFHVERAIFDKILLDNAARLGATVLQGARVLEVDRDGERITGVRYDVDGRSHTARARFVIDASGRAAIVGRTVTTRRYDDKMRQVALYRYYRDVRFPDPHRRNNIIVESCPKGWFWLIPMNSPRCGDASVGLVTGQEFTQALASSTRAEFFAEALSETITVGPMLREAAAIDPFHTISDWAYACDRVAGPGHYLAGDAAVFLDPLLSTGVTLAMLAGYCSSACIQSVYEERISEADAARWYDLNYRHMYEVTRDFLHYFYASNSGAFAEEMFWKARSALNCSDNFGAKQAFTFLINTIPGNPHPAMGRQVQLFREFMGRLEHPAEVREGSPELVSAIGAAHALSVDAVALGAVPVVNGEFERSWVIDRDTHRLMPAEGVRYDRNRAVLSSTSAWLLGQNFYPVDDTSARLLRRVDGSATWGSILAAETTQLPGAESTLMAAAERLTRDRIVLVRDAAVDMAE
jgi:halogenation protein CepH